MVFWIKFSFEVFCDLLVILGGNRYTAINKLLLVNGFEVNKS
jgi:hypothetical protein